MIHDIITERLSIKDLEPGAYKAMNALQVYVNSSMIKPEHRELIKIRASMINQCAYCVQLHTADARKLGESEQRLYALSVWRESPLFSNEERAILALTDEVTLIAGKGVSDETWQNALLYFNEHMIIQMIMQIITINAWNRISVSTHMILK